MLEKIKTDSGIEVFKLDDRFLSSKYAPENSERQWLESQATQIKSSSSVIVVGGGSGLHIIYLQKMYPNKNIILVEMRSEIIEALKQQYPLEIENIRISNPQRPMEVFEYPFILNALKSSYCVLVHPSANITFGKILVELLDCLRGRKYEAFIKIVEERNSLREAFKNSKNLRCIDPIELLSIKNIESYIDQNQKELSDSIMKIKALRELVV